MKYIRSSKCYFSKWLTDSKQTVIREFIAEMHRVVVWVIEQHEYDILLGMKKPSLLLADNLAKCESWLTARAKKNAFAEAHALVFGTKRSADALNKPYSSPKHDPSRIMLSCTNIDIQLHPELDGFDLLVDMRCFDSRKKSVSVAIPLKKNDIFNKWKSKGTLCSSVILTDKYIQFSFECEEGKRTEGNILGIDPGAVHVLSDDEGNHFGSDMMRLLNKLKRKKRCSKAWWACREEIIEYIELACKSIPYETLQLIVLEDNRRIKNKSKIKGRLNKNMRSVLTGWAIGRINSRIQMLSEENGVSLRRVPAYGNSITCPDCGHGEKANRATQDRFVCVKCGTSRNADTVGATNSLAKFALGTYGSQYKQMFLVKHPYYHSNDGRVISSNFI